ncbi:mitochondrial peripheral inner membrane protein [Perkinsus olseni]|uniref:Mitochondrial peripheral inner membrane protein n=1 Tax=Perkinsus olseni TaxID=32597 RepID=A0A7J6LJX2_PEROL|nr:mitochondrial peripheral inner membrane protein [Perkinsus olseni]
MATIKTSKHEGSAFVEEVKKVQRADSILSGAGTPSTVGDLTPGFRGRLDSSDPFWGLEFTHEMAVEALRKEIGKRVYSRMRAAEDSTKGGRTWRLDPADFDMGRMFADGEESDGYVMKFADFDMEGFFMDPSPPPEGAPVDWNLWEIELFGPMREDVKGMFKAKPVEKERFVAPHGHDYDTIDESELCDFWQCWSMSPVEAVEVVDAVREVLKDPVYVLSIAPSVVHDAHWLSLVRPKVDVEYPIMVRPTNSIPLALLAMARSQATLCRAMMPVLAGGAKLAHLQALLVRLKYHQLVEADPRVKERYRRKLIDRKLIDRFPKDAWPSARWLGPFEKLYIMAQVVFVRDINALRDLLGDKHISGRAVAVAGECPGLAVARAATAARVLLVEGPEMLNMNNDDVSSMAQEVAAMIVSSAMDTPWPAFQSSPLQLDPGATPFSHRFERDPWVPLSRLAVAFADTTGPLRCQQWKEREPSKYTVLVERLARGIEDGRVYMGPRYLAASYPLPDRVRCSLDLLSWALLHQPQRCRLPPREALTPLTNYSDYAALRLADLIAGVQDLLRLLRPGVWAHAQWLRWSTRGSRPAQAPTYGADAFAWKRSTEEGCEALAVRVPPPPCRTVIDAVGSAAAVPVDHLASYIEMRNTEVAESWRAYPALDQLASRVASLIKWSAVLALMSVTVPSVEMLPSRLAAQASVLTCGLLSLGWCSGQGLWLGVLGAWFKIPRTLYGEWPVDDYVIIVALTSMSRRSGLPASLSFPSLQEWVLSTIALPSLFPAVGIQAVWLYLIGSVLGNLFCREMQGQAGMAAVLGYMLGSSLVYGLQSDDTPLSLLCFHDLGPMSFASLYGMAVLATHEAFTPRAKKALGRGVWLKSCMAVMLAGMVCSLLHDVCCFPPQCTMTRPPSSADGPSGCPGRVTRRYLADLSARASAEATRRSHDDIGAADDGGAATTTPSPHQTTSSPSSGVPSPEPTWSEETSVLLDTLPNTLTERIGLPPPVLVCQPEPSVQCSWSSWASSTSTAHHLEDPSEPLPVQELITPVYDSAVGRMGSMPASAVASVCLFGVYAAVARSEAPCCGLARSVTGPWKGGWRPCCFCQMTSLVRITAASLPSQLAQLEVATLSRRGSSRGSSPSSAEQPMEMDSVKDGDDYKVSEGVSEVPGGGTPSVYDCSASSAVLTTPDVRSIHDDIIFTIDEALLAEHVALRTLNSLRDHASVGDRAAARCPPPPNTSRLNEGKRLPMDYLGLITAFDRLMVEEEFLASLERRQKPRRQPRVERSLVAWSGNSKPSRRCQTLPYTQQALLLPSPRFPQRPNSSVNSMTHYPGQSCKPAIEPGRGQGQFPIDGGMVERRSRAFGCAPSAPPPLESSSHLLARYVLRDIYFVVEIIQALEQGRWGCIRVAPPRRPAYFSINRNWSMQRTVACQASPRDRLSVDELAGPQRMALPRRRVSEAVRSRVDRESIVYREPAHGNDARWKSVVDGPALTGRTEGTWQLVKGEDADRRPPADRHEALAQGQQDGEVRNAVTEVSFFPSGTTEDGGAPTPASRIAWSGAGSSGGSVPDDLHSEGRLGPTDDEYRSAEEAADLFVRDLTSRCMCRLVARSILDTLLLRISVSLVVDPGFFHVYDIDACEEASDGVMHSSPASVGIQCSISRAPSGSGLGSTPSQVDQRQNVACQTDPPRPSHLRLLLLMAARRRLEQQQQQRESSRPGQHHPWRHTLEAAPDASTTCDETVRVDVPLTYERKLIRRGEGGFQSATPVSPFDGMEHTQRQQQQRQDFSGCQHLKDGYDSLAKPTTLVEFLPSMTAILKRFVELGDAATESLGPGELTRFHAVRVPAIPLEVYLKRLARKFNCSNSCFVVALIYIDRVNMCRGGTFRINSYSIYRVLLSALLVSTKFYDDCYYSNTDYARFGGVRVSELNSLELGFLKLINWSLTVTPEQYETYRTLLSVQNFSATQTKATALMKVQPDHLSKAGVPHSVREESSRTPVPYYRRSSGPAAIVVGECQGVSAAHQPVVASLTTIAAPPQLDMNRPDWDLPADAVIVVDVNDDYDALPLMMLAV